MSAAFETCSTASAGDREQLVGQLRSEIKHSLASPVRGIAILADLFAEALDSEELDPNALREISDQLSNLARDASDRLVEFGSGPGNDEDV